MSVKGSEVIQIDGVGDVAPVREEGQCTDITNVTSVGVSNLVSHKICLPCNSRIEPKGSALGRCTKLDCRMLQCYDICTTQLSAKILLLADSKIYSVYAYGQVLERLAGTDRDKITEEALMPVSKLQQITFNEKNTIIAFIT